MTEIKLKEQIMDLINNKPYGYEEEITKILTKALIDRQGEDRIEVYDILGDLLLNHSEELTYEDKLHTFLRKHRNFKDKDYFEMDNHIIRNYVLYSGEEILETWSGRGSCNNMKVTGRYYLTPSRIIAIGKKDAGGVGGGGGLISGMISIAISAALLSQTKKHLERLKEKFGDATRASYGMEFPLFNIDYIHLPKKPKDPIGWAIKMKIPTKKGIEKDRFIGYSFVPLQKMMKSTPNFEETRDRIYSKVQSILEQNKN